MEIVANTKQKVSPDDIPNILDFLQSLLQGIPEQSWSQEMIMKTIEDGVAASGFKKGQILWVLRSMLTGRAYSPGAYEVAALLTKEEALKRLTAELKA